MSATSLRKLLEEASSAIATYKRPDIGEAQERLNEVLVAADLGSTGSDVIDYIRIWRGTVSVRTTYSVRCCTQHGDFEFPEAILDASDPIAMARRWGLTGKRDEAAKEVAYKESLLDQHRATLAALEAKLAALPACDSLQIEAAR